MDREHLLMALADVEHILVRANFADDIEEAGYTATVELKWREKRRSLLHSISNVMMTTSLADSYRPGIAVASTSPVEMCSCPQGYTGLSCEKWYYVIWGFGVE